MYPEHIYLQECKFARERRLGPWIISLTQFKYYTGLAEQLYNFAHINKEIFNGFWEYNYVI